MIEPHNVCQAGKSATIRCSTGDLSTPYYDHRGKTCHRVITSSQVKQRESNPFKSNFGTIVPYLDDELMKNFTLTLIYYSKKIPVAAIHLKCTT